MIMAKIVTRLREKFPLIRKIATLCLAQNAKNRLFGSAILQFEIADHRPAISPANGRIWIAIFCAAFIQARDYQLARKIDPRLCRLLWRESDGLPGLIVDRYVGAN
jgi:23S rRNA G2069 N7-methylase RlmK/C1962 C5-methylase RlmI